jgi:integrase
MAGRRDGGLSAPHADLGKPSGHLSKLLDANLSTVSRARLEASCADLDVGFPQAERQRRDRALVAFTILTGARDRAIASMKLRQVDLIDGRVHQDAREVRTKFGKTFSTTFFPVGEDVREIVADWIGHLRTVEL